MKVGYLGRGVGLASVVLLVALGSASADEWFVLSEKTIKSTDPSVEIKAEAGKMWKEDVKKTKISVEGADVEITKVVLHWKGRKDDTITNVGVREVGRTNGCEGRSRTRGDPHVGGGPVQDPQ